MKSKVDQPPTLKASRLNRLRWHVTRLKRPRLTYQTLGRLGCSYTLKV